MDIFLEFVKKHTALKKVYDVIFSCINKHHLDGARRLVNLYIKNYRISKEEASKIWHIWEMKKKHVTLTRPFDI